MTVSQESKLQAAKDIIANYVKNDKAQTLSPEQVCDFFKQLYHTIDDTLPESNRKIGLG
jgi:hypothetical protein